MQKKRRMSRNRTTHDFGTQEEAYSNAFEYIIKNKIINQIKK